MTSERELELEAVLAARQAQLLEAGRLVARERLLGEIGERGSAPEAERPVEQRARQTRIAVCEREPRVGHELLEARGIQLARLDDERVARRPPDQPARGQQAAQLREVEPQDARCGRRRRVAPDGVDQRVGRDALPGAQQERRKQRALSPRGELDRRPGFDDLQGTEYAELHLDPRDRS